MAYETCTCAYCGRREAMDLSRDVRFAGEYGPLCDDCLPLALRVVEANAADAADAANASPDPALLALAVRHLAEWALAVDDDANWDGWDSYYKDARWNPGPLRELLDKAMDEIRAEEAAWTYHHEIATGQPDGADGAGEVAP